VRIEELKNAKDRRPFERFMIRTADGREIEIRHPDAVAWDPDQKRIAMCGLPDGAWEILDIALITSLRFPAPAASKPDGDGA
jgi:hypothetical protein